MKDWIIPKLQHSKNLFCLDFNTCIKEMITLTSVRCYWEWRKWEKNKKFDFGLSSLDSLLISSCKLQNRSLYFWSPSWFLRVNVFTIIQVIYLFSLVVCRGYFRGNSLVICTCSCPLRTLRLRVLTCLVEKHQPGYWLLTKGKFSLHLFR